MIEGLSGPFANTGEAVFRNALGAPAAIGDAGIGKVVAVADWSPNVPAAEREAFYRSFRDRFLGPDDD